MTPFLNCNMWEVKRYPFFYFEEGISNHPLTRVYHYNSLTDSEMPENYNDIHLPEYLIHNTELLGMVMENLDALIKHQVPFMRQLNDNMWAFDANVLNQFNQVKHSL